MTNLTRDGLNRGVFSWVVYVGCCLVAFIDFAVILTFCQMQHGSIAERSYEGVLQCYHCAHGAQIGVFTWVVYVACCVVAFLDFAVILTFGTLFVNLLDKYRENRSATATIQSLLIGTTTTSSVFCGLLTKKIGITWSSTIGTVCLSSGFIFSYLATSVIAMNILIGVLAGIGISLLYVNSAIVVRARFDGTAKEHALSGHTIAIGLGLIVYPYLLRLLEQSYSVTGALLILGGLYLNNFAITLLFHIHEKEVAVMKKEYKNVNGEQIKDDDIVRTKENISESNHTSKDTVLSGNDLKGVKTTQMVIWGTASTLWRKVVELMNVEYTLVLIGSDIVLSAMNGYLILIDDILTSKGFSTVDILAQFTALNIASTLARVFPIILTKMRPGADHVFLLILFSLCCCTGQLFIHFASSEAMVYTGHVLSGFTTGGGTCAAIVVIANVTPEYLFGVAFGLFLTGMGILTLAFGPLYGYIRDSLQSYSIALFLTVGLSALAIVLFTASVVRNLCIKGKARTYEVESTAVVT